jgi:hypothetical protein
MITATKSKARALVRKVPDVWQLAAAGVLFTATVEHLRNPGRPRFRRITVSSSVPLQYQPHQVESWLQGQIEAALGDCPCWLRSHRIDGWRTYRHQVFTREWTAADIRAGVEKALEDTQAEMEGGRR